MRADRLISIIMLLQVHRRMTSRELAERLEVSERTIYRDMEALSTSGIPVYAERGAGGGWLLPDGYRTNLTGLSKNEIQTLFLANSARHLSDLGLQNASQSAHLKLLAALPAVFQRDAEYARERIHVDGAGWHHSQELVPHLKTLLEAVWEQRRLYISYERHDSTVERLVDPLGLVAKGSAWYLVASVEGELRSYRVSRVSNARLSDMPFTRPDSFDLAEYWEQSTASFKATLPQYRAVVRAHPSVVPKIQNARYVRVEQMEPADASGWRKLTVDTQTSEVAAEFVLGLGPFIEVIEPAQLRENVIDLANGIISIYANHSSK